MTVRITIIKKFTYRGNNNEEWSNSYYFTGANFSSLANFQTFADALILREKACYRNTSTVVRAYGYNAGHDVADYVYPIAVPPAGSLVIAGTDVSWAGDQAGWLRTKIGVTSTGKGKYLRKYFHDGGSIEALPNTVSTNWKTAVLTFGAAIISTGILPDDRQWCSESGVVGAGGGASDWVTTRTLKRRGRRPT